MFILLFVVYLAIAIGYMLFYSVLVIGIVGWYILISLLALVQVTVQAIVRRLRKEASRP